MSVRKPSETRASASSYTEFSATGPEVNDYGYEAFAMPENNGRDSEYIDLTAPEGRRVQTRKPAARRAKPEHAPEKKAHVEKAVKAKKKKKLNAKGKAVIAVFSSLVVLGGAAAAGFYYMPRQEDSVKVKKDVVIEVGATIKLEDFFAEMPESAVFLTDISDIDTTVPAIYQLKVGYDRGSEDVTLRIEDHTGPEGTAIAQTVYTTWKMPEAEECVDNLYDLSGIAKVRYQNDTPVFSEGGLFDIPVIVTDMYGNDTKIRVPFTVLDDRSAPTIEGVHDMEITKENQYLDLLEGVVAYDDYDLEPVIRVNDATVNYKKSGDYEISYSAMDKAGNVTVVTAMLTIKLPDADKKVTDSGNSNTGSGSSSSSSSSSSDDSDPAYGLAENVMSGLWRSSDVETARAIFNWVHSHISYQSISTYMTYEEAAYRGFTKKSGDCYVYFACAKMLLDCAGIPNMMVERFPVYTNGHYWNLVYLDGEWYHCDATVFRDHPSMYFMCTDDEIDDSHHSFNGALYPERAGGSSEYLNSDPTPTPEPTATPTPAPTDTPAPTPTDTPKTEPTDPNVNDGGNQDAYIPDNPIDGEDGDTYEKLPPQPGPNQDMPYGEYGDYIVQEW
jgi:hypothetical protein